MRTRTILAMTLLGGPLLACGPTVEQSPERQRIADAVHHEVVRFDPTYRDEGGVKALAACLAWKPEGVVQVSGVFWYYIPARYAVRSASLSELSQLALGECTGKPHPPQSTCECVVIDQNARNAIATPAAFTAPSVSVEFWRAPRAKKRKLSQPVPTPQELLEQRAGQSGKGSDY